MKSLWFSITKSLWFVWCIEEIHSDYKITMILYGALQNHHDLVFRNHYDFVWCINHDVLILYGALTFEESYSMELILEEFDFKELTFEENLFPACGHLHRAAICNVRPLATCSHLQRAAACRRHAMAVDTHAYVLENSE